MTCTERSMCGYTLEQEFIASSSDQTERMGSGVDGEASGEGRGGDTTSPIGRQMSRLLILRIRQKGC